MRPRLYVAGVFGGMVVLALVVVVVFAFGRNDPSPPSLADNPRPEIPGEILYLDRDFCFHRAAASGAGNTMLACLPNYSASRLYWIDDTTAGMVQLGTNGTRLYEVDITSGALSPTGRPVQIPDKGEPPGLFGGEFAPDGAYAFFTEEGELVILENGVRTTVTEFDVPRYNQPRVVLWSPDSRWILAQHYLRDEGGPQLWIISRDGRVKGTLTEESAAGVGGLAAWRIEGVGSSPTVPD